MQVNNYFNRRYGRHGHLVDGRYKAKLVEGDSCLLALSRYVHLNPVQVGVMKDRPIDERIRHLRQYRWSSYPSSIEQSPALRRDGQQAKRTLFRSGPGGTYWRLQRVATTNASRRRKEHEARKGGHYIMPVSID